MRTLSVKRGFTLIELLVVVAIIAVLAAILFPVFGKAKAKARQTTCVSNMRQLALAAEMYGQDNKSWPDAATWVGDLAEYANGNAKLFNCPADENGDGYVSYSYNGLLVDPAGQGVAYSAVVNPSALGVFIDGTSAKYPSGTVVNYSNSDDGVKAGKLVSRHSYCIAYLDGHAESFGRKESTDTEDIYGAYARAFFLAGGFGWIKNDGGGVVMADKDDVNSGAFDISGSTTVEPIWQAAIKGWVAGEGDEPTVDCQGSDYYNVGDIGGASSSKGTPTDANVIATDAMGIIVSASSKLSVKSLSKAEIVNIFGKAATLTTAKAALGNPSKLTIYTRDSHSGTREFLTTVLMGQSDPDKKGVNAVCVEVASAQEMIAKVAADPYAVGYAGLGEIDPLKVKTLGFEATTDVVQQYTRAAVKATTATTWNDEDSWKIVRPLYGYLNGSTNDAATAFWAYVKGDFQKSLLFKSAFFPAKALTDYPSKTDY
jgi:prepilin-type N-terminal cleavage/methylation domain-containing protein